MVRFQRDRWYSAAGQQELRARTQREKTSPTLHLVKLFVLLAVVVVVMKQSANSKVYDRFFLAMTGSPIASPTTDSPNKQVPDNNPTTGATAPTDKSVSEVAKEQIWTQLFRGIPSSEIDLIGRRVYSTTTVSEPFELKPISKATVTAFRDRLKSWDSEYESAGLQESADAKLLQEFQNDWLTWENWFLSKEATLPTSLSLESIQAFRDAIDAALIETLRDGSQWRTVEHAAFSRSLQLASKRNEQGADSLGPIVETLVLDGEINTYRGRWVRFRGTIARGPERHVAKSPEFGTVEYWIAWLRPLDSSNQPVCVYFAKEPSSPPSLESKTQDGEIANWILEVDARVLKRLAYAAQNGIEVAPVLVAATATWFRDTQLLAGPSANARPTPSARLWSPPSRDITLARSLKLLLDAPMKNLTPMLIDQLASENPNEPDLAVVQLLYQLRRQPEVVKQLATVPDQVRMGVPLRSVQGWVTKVEEISLKQEIREWFDSPSIFRLTLESFSTDTLPAMKWIVYAARVPKFWLEQTELKQPVVANGLVLDASGDLPTLLMVAELEWAWPNNLPEDQFQPQLPKQWSRLGNQGWNLSQLDSIATLQTKSLAATEANAFYSLLDLTPKLHSLGESAYVPVIETLRNPNDLALRDTKTTVNIIRISRVSIENQDESQWKQGDAYYQIDGMASLGKERIQISGAPGTPKIEFEGEYPVTLVTKELPKWLLSATANGEPQDPYRSQESSDVWYPHVLAEVDGLFYRLWGYTSQAIERQGESARQFGPLIFVRTLSPAASTNSAALRNQLNYMTILVLVGIAGIVWLAFILNRGKRKTDFSLPSRRDKKTKDGAGSES